MLFTTTSEAQQHFQDICATVLNDREIIVMQHENGQQLAFLAADELESLLETVHLLRSPANAERLLTALRRAQDGTLQPESVAAFRTSFGM
jgi:antitoxin YefM